MVNKVYKNSVFLKKWFKLYKKVEKLWEFYINSIKLCIWFLKVLNREYDKWLNLVKCELWEYMDLILLSFF